ncbi:zf-HC2 domain-containing protein [Botrimarina mediterranea]|uniref:anti-sigma factor family protein n=1 Tax=Botrimarina mediterranea TaxID=2528022 RepID=UPI00119E2B49
MNCEVFKELLSIYIDGELDSERLVQLEVHLDGCPECLVELAELRSFTEATQSLPLPKPAPDLWDRIRVSMTRDATAAPHDANQSEVASKAEYSSSGFRRFRTAIFATAVLAILGLLIGLRTGANEHHSHKHGGLRAFIEHFSSDSAEAQEALVANYSGYSIRASAH